MNRKAFATTLKDAGAPRTVESVITTESVDRQGDVIMADGIDTPTPCTTW